jgi:hypothetical protein
MLVASLQAHACNSGSVRDAGFQAKRDVHRLCVFTDGSGGEGDAIMARLRSWHDTDAKYLNVQLEQIDANDAAVQWNEYGIPSRPPKAPVAALIGLMPTTPRRPFVITHWEPAPNDTDLAALLTSPARDAIKRSITDVWAVVLYSPGARPEERKDAVLKSVLQKWAAERAPGISIVSFDREDPRERVLCAFAGLDASRPDWAGVVFGRGKLMAPPLEGADITEANLDRLLTSLTVQCTCLQQSMTLGLDLPLTWEPEMDTRAAPAVQSLGYTEIAVGGTPSPAIPASRPEPPLTAEIPRDDQRVLATALLPLGGAALIAVAAVVWMLLRNGRRAAPPEESCGTE